MTKAHVVFIICLNALSASLWVAADEQYLPGQQEPLIDATASQADLGERMAGIWRGRFSGNNVGSMTLTLAPARDGLAGICEWFGYQGGLSFRPVRGLFDPKTRMLKLHDEELKGIPNPGWLFGKIEDYSLRLVGENVLIGTYSAPSVTDYAVVYLWRDGITPTASGIWEGSYANNEGHCLFSVPQREPSLSGKYLGLERGNKSGIGAVNGLWPGTERPGWLQITFQRGLHDPGPAGPAWKYTTRIMEQELALVGLDTGGQMAWWAVRRNCLAEDEEERLSGVWRGRRTCQMNNLGEIVISLVRNDTKVISTIEVFHDRSGFSCGPAEGDWNEETGVVELRQVSFQAAPRPGWTFVNQRFTLTLMGNGLAYGAGDAAGNHITTYLWRENSLPTRGNREIWEGGYPDIGGHVLLTTAYRDDKVNGIAVWVQEGTKGAKGGIGQVSGTWCSAEKRGSIEIVPIKDITDPQPTGPSTRWFLDFTPGKLAVVATDEKGKAAWWAIRRYALP